MEWLSWLLTNIRFAFYYVVHSIAGDKTDEHYEGKEKTITDWTGEDNE